MSEPTALPKEVSGNGQEIWDWGIRLAEWSAKQQKLRELRTDLLGIGKGCGDCDKWMKGSICPRETNVKGRPSGPSMFTPVCGQYVESWSTAKRKNELLKELHEQQIRK